MKKMGLILIALSILSLGINMVSADVPSVTSLGVSIEPNGRILSITVRHDSPSSIHYVSKLEVKVGTETQTIELTPQTTTSFTEEASIASTGSVEVRAYCTLHGWSSWASLGEDSSPPVNQPSGGIPGFTLLSIGLGLVGLTLLHRRDR